MKSPAYLREVSAGAARLAQETLRDIPRIVISAEERLRQKVRSALRLIVAATFFLLSNVVAIGINVSMALAKKAGTEQSREKRAKGQLKTKFRFKERTHLDHKPVLRSQQGKASWYGRQFHNRKTASGKRFNTYAMMAAHRSLPFGTRVKVTNLENKKFCVVEIADRGPFIHDRIIDLSYAAADELGFASKGIAKVQLEIVSEGDIFNYADAVPQPVPQFDAIPQFPSRIMPNLRVTEPDVAMSELEN